MYNFVYLLEKEKNLYSIIKTSLLRKLPKGAGGVVKWIQTKIEMK